MLLKNKYHLTYCSNIFKEKTWKNLFCKLKIYITNLRKFFKKKHIGLSLCLSNSLANEIKKTDNISNLKMWLKKNRLYISSINGFVYQTFHQKKIKENIYLPDWTSKKRLNFTQNLIDILKNIIKKNHDGSISTLPISYKSWTKDNHKHYVLYKTSKHLSELLILLINIKKQIKNIIHLDIEPEPQCMIETYKETHTFFEQWLLPICKKYLIPRYKKQKLITHIYTHIKICYDICHFSVNFENHKEILNSIQKSKIKIGKIQISSALKINLNNNNKKSQLKTLLTLQSSPFLHQTTEKVAKKIKKYTDIKHILETFEQKTHGEMRIHCHISIHEKIYKNIETTHQETQETLKIFLKTLRIKHIEIETYTHNIIYDDNPLAAIIKEYNWAIHTLK